jgi:hypothetical protein
MLGNFHVAFKFPSSLKLVASRMLGRHFGCGCRVSVQHFEPQTRLFAGQGKLALLPHNPCRHQLEALNLSLQHYPNDLSRSHSTSLLDLNWQNLGAFEVHWFNYLPAGAV